ncbi:MAG: hypothetical protein E7352_01500 [Clostridiales bacterium]|nr:hypothetical protein [Clostridiales bacterium]
MACGYCGKNQAVKTYEEIKNGKKQVEYYCLDCYHRLFLYVDESEGDSYLSACPYCGMSIAEVKKGKLVGCANCYKMMSGDMLPIIKKMQGEKAHSGKTPPLEGYDNTIDSGARFMADGFRAQAIALARFERQCNELEVIISKLKAENNYEDAKGYADKLSSMRSKSSIEEEFVWRTRPNLSRQS